MIRFAVVAVICFASCAPYVANAPDGFAPYDSGEDYRAASPDGVLYRVREVDNDPEADLPFWREAMKKRMLDAGYALLSDANITSSGDAGYLLELAAPNGQQDNVYLVALFAAGSDLVLFEATGEVTAFAAHRDAIVAAIQQTQLTR